MSERSETSCPFCGAQLEVGAHSCPSCDLPLLGAAGEHPPARGPAPFDGAELFDGEMLPEGSAGLERLVGPQRGLLAERDGESAPRMRCVVVAINHSEADMLCQMLRAEGILSVVRTPDLYSYGGASVRCEVLVPEQQLQIARQLLRVETPSPEVHEYRISAGAMAMLLGVAAVLVATVAYLA